MFLTGILISLQFYCTANKTRKSEHVAAYGFVKRGVNGFYAWTAGLIVTLWTAHSGSIWFFFALRIALGNLFCVSFVCSVMVVNRNATRWEQLAVPYISLLLRLDVDSSTRSTYSCFRRGTWPIHGIMDLKPVVVESLVRVSLHFFVVVIAVVLS